MKILFIGFSVTAEHKGYVENLNLSEDTIEISKVGLGGVQPHHLSYFIKDIVSEKQFDIVVLEISTAGFRSFLSREKYFFSLYYMLSVIIQSGALPVILDIPRADVDYNSDWVSELHESVSKKYSVPKLDLIELFANETDKLLRDGIHTSEEGSIIFGRKVGELLNPIIRDYSENQSKLNFGLVEDISLDAVSLADGDLATIQFERSGYKDTFVRLSQNETITKMLSGKYIHGVSYLMGPSSGWMLINDGTTTLEIKTKDNFCYYTRLGCQIFNKALSSAKVIISTLAKRVDIKMIKGDEYTGPIENPVGRLLVSSEQDIDYKKFTVQAGFSL